MSTICAEAHGSMNSAANSAWTLGDLCAGIVEPSRIAGHELLAISGVFDDSREVRPGGVFVAVRGGAVDAKKFVLDATARGAAVIIATEPPQVAGALTIPVENERRVLARLAMRWHGLDRPGATMRMVGVTGTNGKSTTAMMARAIFQAAGVKCGLLGTIRYDLCARSVTADMTTPGPVKLAEYLRECREAGAKFAVMEVSSHALDQRRTDGLRFSAAAFTNLTGDHLDYHKTQDNYREAKRRLFTELPAEAVAVLNGDDPASMEMARDCPARIARYSLDDDGEIRARLIRDTVKGTLYRMRLGGEDLVLENALVGRHNVYNAMAAAGLAHAVGVSLSAIQQGLNSVRNVPGRLQRVPCAIAADVFVDYAHTDDALRNVLSVLRPLAKRRLITVFGCGGDRDRTKRPRMAKVAAEYSDLIFVTSDNPRTEEPLEIIREILTGFEIESRDQVICEPDRRAAISLALGAAGEGDIVLIAGKGHEDYQVIGTQKIHFDDVEVAIEAAAEAAGKE
ncbi:MAG: UDP-N-acetylmuramoyl-L-alanyl-D-glutamate--2,6-diaminopimelate ligase [Phycisphaerales bacterium]|nr:UDP-N-acetylmuramoyl-L-alanyl-D-glutamate--2,6-diaminopimelate ligase [Phycisphaerales bacterium]